MRSGVTCGDMCEACNVKIREVVSLKSVELANDEGARKKRKARGVKAQCREILKRCQQIKNQRIVRKH